MMLPETEAAVAAAVRAAAAPLLIQGQGTKTAMLRPVQAAATLSTARLSGITLYAPNELVMAAKSGTRLSEIEAALAARGQQMIAEPSHFFGQDQTIGGVVAANISGPRRVMGGATRDHILGVRLVDGRGDAQNFGGRVLKNVTGLDIAKFVTGSFGTLAVLTEVTFKVLPAAEATGTVLVHGMGAERGVEIMSAGLGSAFSVSGAAYLPARQVVALRIEDFAASVAYRVEKLAAQFQEFGLVEILDTPASRSLWADIRDATMLPPGEAVWRVMVAPSSAPRILQAVEPHGVGGVLDWGGGLIWLSGPADAAIHEAVCAAASAARGVWCLVKAPVQLRAAVAVVPPEPPALAAIRERVRRHFDPRGIFNPGRMRAA